MAENGTVRLDDASARLAWVDVAKGICILLVVMMHSTLGTGAAMGDEGFLHAVVAFAQPFRIPAFFLLSGLFLGRVIDREWRTFADRRLVQFAYFYLLWVVIQSVAKYGQIVEGAGPAAFLTHLATALVEPYSTLWFIYLLAVFSMVTKLLRMVPGPILLIGAMLLQTVPVPTASSVVEEFCARYVWFMAGYLFADRIFAFADIVRRRPIPAIAGLALWVVIDGALAFTPSGHASFPTLASLHGVSMAVGSAGALAIVAVASLLTRAGGPLTGALRQCGERSIVIYLSFFLPMAATRAVLVKTGLLVDIGWASLMVTAVAATTPLVLERLIRQRRSPSCSGGPAPSASSAATRHHRTRSCRPTRAVGLGSPEAGPPTLPTRIRIGLHKTMTVSRARAGGCPVSVTVALDLPTVGSPTCL